MPILSLAGGTLVRGYEAELEGTYTAADGLRGSKVFVAYQLPEGAPDLVPGVYEAAVVKDGRHHRTRAHVGAGGRNIMLDRAAVDPINSPRQLQEGGASLTLPDDVVVATEEAARVVPRRMAARMGSRAAGRAGSGYEWPGA
jgi:hypothetical protein